MNRVFVVVSLLLLLAAPVLAAGPPADLPVTIVETPEVVHVRVRVGDDIDPGSVEVEFDGATLAVKARDRSGIARRSRPLRVSGALVENGVGADYDGTGWLTVTIPKRR